MATTKVTTDVIDMSGNAGGLTWVKGTTAQRPARCTHRRPRENTETKRTEVYTDETGTAEWRNLKEAGVSINVEYLVVAGGGGGGAASGGGGGGGGAGGLLTNFGGTAFTASTGTAYDIKVGIPGTGATSSATAGTNGGNSEFTSSYVAVGGGGGSGFGVSGSIGGSGGGGAGNMVSSPGIAGTAGQGTSGGNGGR